MNYKKTLDWMYACLPMYQKIGQSAYRANLDNTLLLDTHLNHPHLSFKTIHVAGTTGKGSTSNLLASVLQEAGLKVGLYTSPHLKDFRERIRVNGRMVSKRFVTSFIARHQSFFETHSCSFFEMNVGMAFAYFKEKKIDIAVIEVGMGGRLDSTNILKPLVSVITNIGFDHMQFLGDTLEKIATEKAGIIKPNIPVVIGEYQPETFPVFAKTAQLKNAELYLASQNISQTYPAELKGDYQVHNIKTCLQTIEILNKIYRFGITENQIKKGLLNVSSNTGFLGRWQVLGNSPKIIADTAHNAEGLTYVVNQLAKETYQKLHLVLGFVQDKDLEKIIPLFPEKAIYYFCKPNLERGLDASETQKTFEKFGLIGLAYSSVGEAFDAAKKTATTADLIFVGGSTFVVAEAL